MEKVSSGDLVAKISAKFNIGDKTSSPRISVTRAIVVANAGKKTFTADNKRWNHAELGCFKDGLVENEVVTFVLDNDQSINVAVEEAKTQLSRSMLRMADKLIAKANILIGDEEKEFPVRVVEW